MAYIGNSPALKYASFAVQHFTTSATTGYTLDNAVTNENGIALFVNNVRQQPGSSYAYTVSGTTLTLSAATTTSDTMYCVFIGKAVQTVNPGAGSVGLSQLSATGTASSSTFLRGDNAWQDPGGVALTGSTNNTVVTVTGADAIAGEAKLLFDPAKLTIGNASEEDTSIVFDGHAQDYYIGLDDTDDDLKIGLGSAVGTTSYMVFDEAGAVTKPLQPAFYAEISGGNQDNIAINTAVTVLLNSEVFDVNADFNTGTYTFTAPVTGKYHFSVKLACNNVDAAASYYDLILSTSNKAIYLGSWAFNGYSADATYFSLVGSCTCDMDTSDTALVTLTQGGGTAQTDLNNGTYMTGHLVC